MAPGVTGPPATKRIYLSPPHMGPAERELLLDAFDSNWIAPLGPHVDAFEREFCETVGVPHAAALSSGTAALHLALLMLGVGPGDEVLVSTFTFAATANAVTYLGAKPVFIDSDRETWNMDPGLLEEELAGCARRGKLPKAVIAVDLYGQCADYDRILAACGRYGVPLVEDAAEALGATYKGKPAGSFGAAAAFSFNGNKIITTSGGGMLVSRDAGLVERARYLSQQARDPAPHYQHSTIGYNYRMSNLLAAVGRGQLKVLEDRVSRKREIFRYYKSTLGGVPGLSFMPEAGYGCSNRWLTCMLVRFAPVWCDEGGHPAGAGTGKHRVPAPMEADAPAAGLQGLQDPGRGGIGGSLRAGTLSPQRDSVEGCGPRADRRDRPESQGG